MYVYERERQRQRMISNYIFLLFILRTIQTGMSECVSLSGFSYGMSDVGSTWTCLAALNRSVGIRRLPVKLASLRTKHIMALVSIKPKTKLLTLKIKVKSFISESKIRHSICNHMKGFFTMHF